MAEDACGNGRTEGTARDYYSLEGYVEDDETERNANAGLAGVRCDYDHRRAVCLGQMPSLLGPPPPRS
jgi:hypothetical protein